MKDKRGVYIGAISTILGLSPVAQAASPLSAYNVAPNTVTVAGISSGGYMAAQLQIAYSKSIFGTAIFAGGPYYCAQGSQTTALGYCESGNGIPLQTLINYTNRQAANGTIDPAGNISNKPIYMFSGTNDTTVHQGVMNTLQQYYETYTSSSNITYDYKSQAAHAWISPDGPNSCNSSSIPYINNCGMDAEQTFLTMFYGKLSPKNAGALTGSYIQFDQNPFASGGSANSISMDSTGWLFVPTACANGKPCRLVVVLHGCLQYQGVIQQQFVQKSGINKWADTNNIIVLYPQATSLSSSNPLGCWDWWGYLRSDYALKSAPQMKAIMAMVTQITGGNQATGGVPTPPPVTPPPTSTVTITSQVVQHYVEGRITVAQYLQLGQEYGHNTPITLYLCGSTWTDSSTCGPMH